MHLRYEFYFRWFRSPFFIWIGHINISTYSMDHIHNEWIELTNIIICILWHNKMGCYLLIKFSLQFLPSFTTDDIQVQSNHIIFLLTKTPLSHISLTHILYSYLYIYIMAWMMRVLFLSVSVLRWQVKLDNFFYFLLISALPSH